MTLDTVLSFTVLTHNCHLEGFSCKRLRADLIHMQGGNVPKYSLDLFRYR